MLAGRVATAVWYKGRAGSGKVAFLNLTGPRIEIPQENMGGKIINDCILIESIIELLQFSELGLALTRVRAAGWGAINAGEVKFVV